MCVNFQVFVKVRLLSECLTAIGNGADKGTLACVWPQMVQEIVHFSEHHVAFRMVALHQSIPATRPRVQVLVDPKFIALEHFAPQLYLT